MAEDSNDAAVITERRGNVLVITLNRPEVRNAVNAALAEGVGSALDELDSDDELRLGILTGAGGFFCAGMDLGAFVKGESPYYEGRGFAGIAERASEKPLIAAIEGFAVAGGLEIALSCDLIVAAKGAKMGIPEAKRSLVAAAGALLRLPKRMPYHAVMELALSGDPWPAERFHELGVVNRLVEPGERARRSPRHGRSAQRERATGLDGLEEGPPGAVRLERRGDVAEAGRHRRPGDDLRGREGGRDRVQGEARPGLEGSLALQGVGSITPVSLRPITVAGPGLVAETLIGGNGQGQSTQGRAGVRDRRDRGGRECATAGTAAAQAPPPKLKTAIVQVAFKNEPNKVLGNVEQAKATLQDGPKSVNSLMEYISGGRLTITGRDHARVESYGPYVIPSQNSAIGPCQQNAWIEEATAEAKKAGVDLASYDRVIWGFPKLTSKCEWAGFGGGRNVWQNDNWLDGVLAHELGHTFQWNHAGNYTCTVGGQRVALAAPASCTRSDGGDPWELMGTGQKRTPSAFRLLQAHFLDADQRQVVTRSGEYTISPMQPLRGQGTKVLRIPRLGKTAIDLEFRQPHGTWDNYDATDPVVSRRHGPLHPQRQRSARHRLRRHHGLDRHQAGDRRR